jgi:hypothetical protein
VVVVGLTGIVTNELSEALYHFKVYVPEFPEQPVAMSDALPPVAMEVLAYGVGIGETEVIVILPVLLQP